MKDDERSGCPRSHRTDKNFGKVQNMLDSDRRSSIRVMAVQLNLDKGTAKRPELWPNNWILHHDNVPAHKQFVTQKSITEMEHPPPPLFLRFASE
jgi:hypothetical protein